MEERKAQHIGGKHIPLPELERFDLTGYDANQHFYFYCQTGIRSLQAAKRLRAKGYENAFSLKNGISDCQFINT